MNRKQIKARMAALIKQAETFLPDLDHRDDAKAARSARQA